MPKTPNFDSLSDDAKVWIYQSDRPLTEMETSQILLKLSEFTTQWVSHSQQLTAAAEITYDRFIILAVDETQSSASGCSIDSSVHFLKQLEQEFSIDLFDRTHFAYLENGVVTSCSIADFRRAYANTKIHDDTLVFDNLVKTLGDYRASHIKPLSSSWHKQLV